MMMAMMRAWIIEYVGQITHTLTSPWEVLDITKMIGPMRQLWVPPPISPRLQLLCCFGQSPNRTNPKPPFNLSVHTEVVPCLYIYTHHLHHHGSYKHTLPHQEAFMRFRAIAAFAHNNKALFIATTRTRTSNHLNSRVPFFIRNTMSASHQSPAFDTPRMVVKKVLAKSQSEGDGAVVRRAIGM